MRARAVNIAGNFVLAAIKGAVGIVTHSIAITLDALNSLSDAVSSVVTIAGKKLENRVSMNPPPIWRMW